MDGGVGFVEGLEGDGFVGPFAGLGVGFVGAGVLFDGVGSAVF